MFNSKRIERLEKELEYYKTKLSHVESELVTLGMVLLNDKATTIFKPFSGGRPRIDSKNLIQPQAISNKLDRLMAHLKLIETTDPAKTYIKKV